ncbi:AraC family transcriptional regulator [Rhodovastum atsumiense]|uniref:AraC family transcriptional regulator n=1 Tax=Rhodovastum atsumiense TaxID=504468 RepID=A0A5M6ILV2_9PROT|nr:AraC family transcriptional regulator [Rhodovastum atsumiense]
MADPALPVIPFIHDSSDRFVSPPHRHGRAQLVWASAGIVTVRTGQGEWVIPPNRAVWIPAETEHVTGSRAAVAFRTLYLRADAVPDAAPDRCAAVAVSPLLRELILRATALPRADLSGRFATQLFALLREELRFLPDPPLHLPLPQDARLAGFCAGLLADPATAPDLITAAARLGMSRRSFIRLFQRDLGMSYGHWRQQARLLASLPMLAEGRPMLGIALDLGYQSPSAFSAVFRRVFGVVPTRYFRPE